ncbi:transcriptional regulator, AraC family [Lancefieldella parvula DSM 20469]|uniref:Transcriptional regulator, AraC family n=1 Tax=Lancefieldella parvula (strain ATCC 33793 / DSM 20469 / CCUG 32760 / JCM 10300 / KCTC 3663 / VPI 0546 / 1246) TaxID=521095 RepID=C8W9R7_LANP1|nr:AraC family transcriptional regulator [Lancefieldella parvula]ACV50855.1 transcriptional regulator, AraC family [Lancefieldella parvula DSM 20469]
MIESFNNTIDYIDTELANTIDEKKIAQLSGYSFPLFSRIFSILTDMTLSEYIRNRKLSQAAVNLRNTNEKVIDIAMKYGYESADSFTAAFKRFHGFTPTEVRSGKPFKVFSRVQLALSIQGGRTMEVKIQRKPGFKIAGISAQEIETSLCNGVWKKLFSKCSFEELSKIGNGQSFGMCYDVENINSINYLAGFDVTDVDRAQKYGLEIVDIPEAEYAVVKLHGPIPTCIHDGWKYVMEVFFPEHGYVHAGTPDFEVYSEGDMNDSAYEMELWIPVVKASKA